MAIIMPMAMQARTLGIVIESGPLAGVAMQAWSNVAGSAGDLTMSEWIVPEVEDESMWTPFLRAWSAELPRAPWRWGFWERSRIGYLLPEYRRSRKAFTAWGCDTGKEAWPSIADRRLFPPLGDSDSEQE